jgi:hypothetical protein
LSVGRKGRFGPAAPRSRQPDTLVAEAKEVVDAATNARGGSAAVTQQAPLRILPAHRLLPSGPLNLANQAARAQRRHIASWRVASV